MHDESCSCMHGDDDGEGRSSGGRGKKQKENKTLEHIPTSILSQRERAICLTSLSQPNHVAAQTPIDNRARLTTESIQHRKRNSPPKTPIQLKCKGFKTARQKA